MRKWLYICSVLWLLTACHDDALSILDMKSPCVDERFWESMVYTANQRCADTIYAHSEQYNVYVCTDSHLDTTTYNLRGFIKEYHADTLCPFAIHLGDYMRYKGGMGRIEEAYTDPTLHTSGKVDTAFFCLGNHDLFFTQWYYFKQLWHRSVYSFVVLTPSGARDEYICLDTAGGTLGAKQLKWLKELLAEIITQPVRHLIIYSHNNLFRMDNMSNDCSTLPLEETMMLLNLMRSYGVEQYWSGHDHCREVVNYMGTDCVVVDALDDAGADAGYMVVHVDALNGLNIEFRHAYWSSVAGMEK